MRCSQPIKLLFFLLCYLFYLNAKAQLNRDSFRNTHKKETYEERISAYLNFGEKIGQHLFEDVISVAEEGIIIASKNKDLSAVGTLKRQIGEAYYFKGNYNTAAEYFYASIGIFERSNQLQKLADSYNALAKLYRKTKDLERSLENYDKAMNLFKTLKDSAGIAMIYNESGVVFEYKEDYKEASRRYSASLSIDEIKKDTTGICYALSNLAGVYTIQNNFATAENYLKKSLLFRKKMNDQFALALNYSDLANTFFSAKEYEKAKVYVDSSNYIAEAMGYPELRGSNFNLLSHVAEKQGDFEKALSFNKLRTAISDSIFNIEKSKKIEELNTRYETEKKERTIVEQKDKIVLQNTIMIAAIVLVMLGSFLAYANYRRYQWRQEAKLQAETLLQQNNAIKAVIDAEETERKRIATDLHHGVGQIMSAAKMNLSAYEQYADFQSNEQKENFQKIISLVDEGCREVRAVSHNMMPTALLTNNLPDALNDFLTKLDHNALKVHLQSEGFHEPISTNIESVLYRVLQECINNVIKHANADVLDISLIKEPGEIFATIEDNGRGFDTSKNVGRDGIGLKNIFTRIEFLKGTVDLSSAPGRGTQIAIYVPVLDIKKSFYKKI